MSDNRAGAVALVLILVIALLLAAGNLIIFASALRQAGSEAHSLAGALGEIFHELPAYPAYLGAAHVLAGLLIGFVLLFTRSAPGAVDEATAPIEKPAPHPAAAALRLLALMQQEGRLIDFLEEDIDAYSDEQVGAAVRSIHAGCRKALHERMEIRRLFPQEDGADIELAAGFDPSTVRLTGNVHGQPPFRGTIQHGGWRAEKVRLPDASPNLDPSILAPAEIEI
jgi:hypothetical protein